MKKDLLSLMISSTKNHTKTINLSGVGSEITNYILPINIHRGGNTGDELGSNVYLNGQCKTDFSDVFFTDESDNILEHYLAGYVNAEIVSTQNRAGRWTIILSDGSMLATGIKDLAYSKLYSSSDNGLTWNILYTGSADVQLLYVDSREYVYIVEAYKLKRSTDGGSTFADVLDMSAVEGWVQPFSVDEDGLGNLFIGRYQESLNMATIYKSDDDGETWDVVYFDDTLQHIHGLKIDPTNDYIYAGVDEADITKLCIVRSVDHGANWTKIFTGLSGNATGIYCGDGYRLFGAESADEKTIKRTTDDETFTTVLASDCVIKAIQKLDNKIFALGVSFYRNNYPAIFVSEDEGLTWKTLWIGNYDNSLLSAGYTNNLMHIGKPTGETQNQIILGGLSGDTYYPTSRLYSGGNRYQSTFYVKVPTLPELGTNIKVKATGHIESSKVSIFTKKSHDSNLVGYWKINEGTGLTVLDHSGNDKHGALRSAGSGTWNDFGIRRVGSYYPDIVIEDNAYHFAGTAWTDSSYVRITDSALDAAFQMVKNFTITAWIKTTAPLEQTIFCKGKNNDVWGLILDGNYGSLGFLYSNGSERKIIYAREVVPAGNAWFCANGLSHMVGVVVDNETPANLYFFLDGKLLTALPLEYDISTNTEPVQIGCQTGDTKYFNGEISEVQLYNTTLTELQLRSIYECRPLGTSEVTTS